MKKTDMKYQAYIEILKEELVPAMGCTEPIALAYAAAVAREKLGCLPERVIVQASGSIIKNVKSVVVPNTAGLKGIAAAAISGIVAGRPERELEVIADVTTEQCAEIQAALRTIPVKTEFLNSGCVFDMIVTLEQGGHMVRVRISDHHTNVVLIEKDGEVLFQKNNSNAGGTAQTDRSLLSVEDIWDFCMSVDPEDICDLLERQISYNMAIAEEGLKNNYGANIGKVLLAGNESDVVTRARAWAAAGSDARMNGCELPVVINSGSGNQGITCTVPVVIYAREYQVSHETLLRALALSNLIAIHEKTGIGTLSAYCGAVSAGAGAGAGIAYITGGGYQEVIHTVVNSLAIVSGIICDGAKASCAAKIAASVDSAILGLKMYRHGQEFLGGDGIVSKGVENTIRNVGRLGRDGMRETNEEIIEMMVGS